MDEISIIYEKFIKNLNNNSNLAWNTLAKLAKNIENCEKLQDLAKNGTIKELFNLFNPITTYPWDKIEFLKKYPENFTSNKHGYEFNVKNEFSIIENQTKQFGVQLREIYDDFVPENVENGFEEIEGEINTAKQEKYDGIIVGSKIGGSISRDLLMLKLMLKKVLWLKTGNIFFGLIRKE